MPWKGWKKHSEYKCQYCGKTLKPRKGYSCSSCNWKLHYFGGLYWNVICRDKSRCVDCGNAEYLNVHHINGDNKDNRMENLETLCVSCHKNKRTFTCPNCGEFVLATSSRQKFCIKCGIKHHLVMMYKHQIKYWEKRNQVRYMSVVRRFNELSNAEGYDK